MSQETATTLAAKLLDSPRRAQLERDCVGLVESEVDKKGGISGFAIKAGFKVVKNVKPGFIDSVVHALLPDWVSKLEDHYSRWIAAGSNGSFGGFCSRDASAVAERLLEVTDSKAKKIDNAGVAKAYATLRPSAKDHVIAAVPGLGQVVDKYL